MLSRGRVFLTARSGASLRRNIADHQRPGTDEAHFAAKGRDRNLVFGSRSRTSPSRRDRDRKMRSGTCIRFLYRSSLITSASAGNFVQKN